MNIVSYISDNWVAIAAAATAAIVLLKAIAKLTPTTKDDEIVARLEAAEKAIESIFDKDPAKAPTQVIKAP